MIPRTKLTAAGVAVVIALAAVSVFAGSAAAAEWHTYEGDVHPGHAYGLDVPAGAESVEVAFTGEPDGAARLAIYGPKADKIGFYDLTPGVSSAALVKPTEGRHVLYVYDVVNGALTVRVNSEKAPSLSLQQIPLVREDVEIARGTGDALDKGMKATLKKQPVFLTLLYEGSVEALDATIASDKGNVVTIAGERGTAFSPGVWSSLSGERTSVPANLEGVHYTIHATAAKFEGTMTLTTLALDLAAKHPERPPLPTPVRPERPERPTPVVPVAEAETTATVVDVGRAIEFTAAAGELILFDPALLAQDEETETPSDDDEDDRHGHHGPTHGSWDSRYYSFVASIYAPDDTLLAYVAYDESHGKDARVTLPVDGAYVIFVHEATDDQVAMRGASGELTNLRELALVEEYYVFSADGWSRAHVEFDLLHAPIALGLRYTDDSLGVFNSAELDNELGVVARVSDTLRAPYFAQLGGWTEIYPENFAAGTHTLSASSLVPAAIEIYSIAYVRDAALPIDEEHGHGHGDHGHDDGSHDDEDGGHEHEEGGHDEHESSEGEDEAAPDEEDDGYDSWPLPGAPLSGLPIGPL